MRPFRARKSILNCIRRSCWRKAGADSHASIWLSSDLPITAYVREGAQRHRRAHRAPCAIIMASGRTASDIGGVIQAAADSISLPFVSCDHDCVGAALTDGLLAVHGLYTALRLMRNVQWERRKHGAHSSGVADSGHMPFATIALGAIISNTGWSTLGACYWGQPGGRKFAGFELVWRMSAQCQVALFYFHYCIGLAYNRLGGYSPWLARHEHTLRRLGLAHALAFGFTCLSPRGCQQHEYVLWGGVNIMFPLVRIRNSHLPHGAHSLCGAPSPSSSPSPAPLLRDDALPLPDAAVPCLFSCAIVFSCAPLRGARPRCFLPWRS